MNPNNPTPASAANPLDYLNQIATPAQRRRSFGQLGPMKWALLGAGLLVIVIIVAVLATTLSARSSEPIETLSVRLHQLSTIVTARQEDIGNTSLSSTNSSLDINLTQLNNDLDKILTSDGKNPTKLNAAIVQKETASTTTINASLDNAKLNALFDSNYASTMAYQLDTSLSIVHQLQKNNNGPNTTKFLTEANTDLSQARDSFAAYDESAL